MRALILSLSFGLILVGCSGSDDTEQTPVATAETVRTVTGGDIIGFEADNGAHVWRGVYFAADTSGANRWRAPRPVALWNGQRQVLEYASVCPQIATQFTPIEGFENGRLEGSENCLAMDIYAPPGALEQGGLPVMLWIHGGSNVSGASQLYVGDRLAMNENVIVLSVQYRLGPLGWFSHPELRATAKQDEDKAANFGLLDLIQSLKWVQSNIDAFGGDKNNITIFGESAGGHNVASLLASPLAKGLFHRAIIQSGSFDSISIAEAEGTMGDQPNPSLAVAERMGGAEQFHKASMQEVFEAYELDRGYLSLPRVIEDGISLPAASMRDVFKDTSTFNDVPVITGTNKDETKLFNMFDDRIAEKFLGYFYVAKDQQVYDAVSEYGSRMWRVRAVDQPIALMNKAGHNVVHAYQFDWDEGGSFLWTDLSEMLGASHAMEIPFVFNRFKLLGAADGILFEDTTLEGRQALSHSMGAYWASFARAGVPSRRDAPDWEVYGDEQAVMHFDSAAGGGIRIRRGAETTEKVLADLAADQRLDKDIKCLLVDSVRGFTEVERETARIGLECIAGTGR